jgi:transglutaminase-like putative cysteine protease
MQYVRVKTDGKAETTGRLMYAMVEKYYRDMVPYAHYGLLEIFDLIRAVPFREDSPYEEVLMRPRYTMSLMGHGGDCDDFAIALASWARLRGIPYKFIAVRRNDKNLLHHVAVLLYINGKWLPFDATYNFNSPGRWRETYAQYKIL